MYHSVATHAFSSRNRMDFFAFVLLLTVLFISSCKVHSVDSNEMLIGAIFDDSQSAKALLYIIEEINNSPDVLAGRTLKAVIRYASSRPDEAFHDIRTVQYLLYQGVVAIVGPMKSAGVKQTHPYCAGFQVPQIAPVATDPVLSLLAQNFPFLIRLSPNDVIQYKALADVMAYFNWTQLAILSSWDDYGGAGIISLKDEAYRRGWMVKSQERFKAVLNPQDVDVRLQLKLIQQTGTRIVVLICYQSYTLHVLTQAAGLGMLRDWVWIVTDSQTEVEWQNIKGNMDISQFYGVIGTRLTLGGGPLYRNVTRKWIRKGPGDFRVLDGKIYDAMIVLAYALDHMIRDGHDVSAMRLRIDDDDLKTWPKGRTLLNYMKKINRDGIMNQLSFYSDGSPVFQEFDIVNAGRTGFVKVGHWSKAERVRIYRDKPVIWLSRSYATPRDQADTVENTTLRVVTVMEHPFISKVTTKTGEEHYEGLCIDLLNKLQQEMKFRYTLSFVPDNVYGALDVNTRTWNGMVQYMIEQKADLAIGPFIVSSQRQTVMDFTQPYMDLGMNILIKKNQDSGYKVFSFLEPFNSNVWLAIIMTTIATGVFLWLHSTFSPYGYHGRCAQAQSFDDITKKFSKNQDCLRFSNAIWSSFAYGVSQGADNTHAVSSSGRVVTGFWWFSVLIISASYTANLASFLVLDIFNTPINSLDDLAGQTKIKYGIERNTHSQTLFQTSHIPTYSKMWAFMNTQDTLVNNVTQGVELTLKGGFAFIGDSVILEYYAKSRPCNTLTTVGRVFGHFGYGFGLPKNSPYTQKFSVKILELRQMGFVQHLQSRWLRGICEAIAQEAGSTTIGEGAVLTFYDMCGVFYSVFGAIVISLTILLMELTWESYQEYKLTNNRNFTWSDALIQRITASWYSALDKSPRRAGEDKPLEEQLAPLRKPVSSNGGTITGDSLPQDATRTSVEKGYNGNINRFYRKPPVYL